MQNLYVYTAPRLFMSGKLYWRIKKNGKWTWKAAHAGRDADGIIVVDDLEEEE